MTEENERIQAWCNAIASLAVDALLDSNLVKKEDFEKAVDIVTEEIMVRLIMGDYPSLLSEKPLAKDL